MVTTPSALDLITGTDSGISSTDDITSQGTVTVTGNGAMGEIISLFDSDSTTVLGTATVDGNGDWSITVALSEGAHTLTAWADDGNGNSPLSTALMVTVDTTAPTPPSAPDLSTGSDSGASDTDDETNVTTPTFTGTAETGSTVTLYDTDGVTALGSAVTDSNGNWSITISTLGEGSHTLTAKTEDVAGNVSVASSGVIVTIDSTVPSIGTPDLMAASDSGVSSSDNLTSRTTPTFTGTAEAGAAITLYDTNSMTVLGATTANGMGNWSIVSATLGDGVHTITARAADAAGNVSVSSSGLSVNIDTIAPSTTPDAPGLDPAQDSGSSNSDGITNNSGPEFAGISADASSWVNVYIDGTLMGTTLSDGSGNYSYFGTQLTDGQHSITARNVDIAGNIGPNSSAFQVIIDTNTPAAPAAPDLAAGSDTGASVTDDITSQTALSLTGTTEADATVSLYDTDGTTLLGTTMADGSGNWSIISSALFEGAHTLTIEAVDAAGNASSRSAGLIVTVDSTAPAAPGTPDLASGSDSGRSDTDSVISSTTPIITGTGAVGSTVTLYDTNGTTVLGSAVVNGGSVWSIASASLSEGVHQLTAKAVDTAGNVSVASGSLSVTIDTTLPTAPPAPALGVASDSGTSNSDGITNVNQPTFTGITEAYATIDLFDTNGETVLGTTTADGSGAWSITVAQDPVTSLPMAGSHTIRARATDVAGNVSSNSSSSAIVIDTTAPALRSAIMITDTALKIGDTATVTFSFTEAVTGFTAADVTAPNSVLSNLRSGDGGITWTATLTPDAGATAARNVLTLDNTGITDVSGNAGAGSTTSGSFAVDTVRPGLTSSIVIDQTALWMGASTTVTFTFTEAVTNFTTDDLIAENAALSALTSHDGGITWTATLTPDSNVTDKTNVITLDNTGVDDLSGNAGSGISISDNYDVDAGLGDDTLTGSVGNDLLTGGAGNDVLMGGGGNDTIDGGDGDDMVVFDSDPQSIRIRVGEGGMLLVEGDGVGTVLLTSIESIRTHDGILRLNADFSGLFRSTAEGDNFLVLGTTYAGPVPGLERQLLATDAPEVVQGTSANDFINLSGGDDAANGGAGNDVLDGGTGSNFLNGGAGIDTFFLDGRASGLSWSTIADWQAGEQLVLWGWRPGQSTANWVESDGADGYRGAAMESDLDGNGSIDTIITWAGVARDQLPRPVEFDGLLWFVG